MPELSLLSIVIPAFNESEGIDHTLASLDALIPTLQKDYRVEVLIINDGSRDNTGALLAEKTGGRPWLRIVTHEVNKGLGAAIRTGLQNAAGDIIVTTDFDGTYEFSTIPQILRVLEDSGADLVTASPYHPQGAVKNVPGYRLMFSFGASLLYRLLVSWRIYCWTALFRAYRRPVVEAVTFESNDFLAGTELLVRAIQQSFKVVEFPTVLHSRVFGQSSIRIARVTKLHLKFQAKLVWERLTFTRQPEINSRRIQG